MRTQVDEVASLVGLDGQKVQATLRVSLLGLLLVVVALQRGGYYAESWGLPTAACAWAVAMGALLVGRQRLRRLEVTQLASLSLLGLLALLSSRWAPGGLGSALPQAQLIALYVSATAAVLMFFSRATALTATICGALTTVCLLGLDTRLFPADLSTFDPTSDNRLYQPLGYWNSLGLWAVLGLCLSAGLTARARNPLLRAAAAAATVPCAVTLYFTFGRAAWGALAIGLVVALTFDPRRVGLLAWLILTCPWSAAAVLVASRSQALTSVQPVLADARSDGRILAVTIAALALGAAFATFALAHVEMRVRLPASVHRMFIGSLIAVALVGTSGAVHRFGPPWEMVRNAVAAFEAPPVGVRSLNDRLLDLSSNSRIELWRVAWHDSRSHPLLGSGAGTYATAWYKDRSNRLEVVNAHELYLETLAELGPAGLLLLLIALATPLVAAWRGRQHPLAAGATAAYVAFLVHVGVDWDWQLAAVGLAAFTCGAVLLVTARGSRSPVPGRRSRVALTTIGVALTGFALWSLNGSYPLGQARNAMDDGEWSAAAAHASAAVARDGSFSATAWQFLGEAQTALKNPLDARRSLRIAVRRDPSSWKAWYDLAVVARGAERREAARKALTLNPLGPETQSIARVARITLSSP